VGGGGWEGDGGGGWRRGEESSESTPLHLVFLVCFCKQCLWDNLASINFICIHVYQLIAVGKTTLEAREGGREETKVGRSVKWCKNKYRAENR